MRTNPDWTPPAVVKADHPELPNLIPGGSPRNPIPLGRVKTPTLALIDKQGIVRWYHPGNASEAELVQRIEALL